MITHVAIRQDGVIYSLPKPCRHHDVIHVMVQHCGVDAPVNGEQGFLYCQRKFVSREEARIIAFSAEQTHKKDGKLYSEDLW